MEITSKILNVSDKYPNKRSFQIIIDSKEEWASFWYSGKQGQAQSSVVQMVKSLNKGDEATFEVKQNGRWWNINHIMPHKDVNADVNADVNEDPGPTELPQDPEREATQMAEEHIQREVRDPGHAVDTPVNSKSYVSSSFDKCNSMNASVALLVAAFENNQDKTEKEIIKIYKELLKEVISGANELIQGYHGK